jgi:phosphatidylserine/phosphatidylglycerophosphate/cardiolipin synthase-like enzyme
MSVSAAVERVLRQLSGDQVRTLASAVEPHAKAPGSFAGVIDGGPPATGDAVARLQTAWRGAPGLTGAGVALALRVGLEAAEQASARRAHPVWTGPEAKGQQRLTAAVLHELVAGARERVLLVSFAAHTLGSLAHDLQAAVERGIEVDVLFETADDSAGAFKSADDQPFGTIAGIRRWRWPRERRDPGALLHAKALVIDGRRALVGSANLTRRALTANLELGLALEDPDVAGAIEVHVRQLIDAGVIVPVA